MSDLTAVDAPSRNITSGYTAVHGIFSGICCAFLCIMVMDVRKDLKVGIYLFATMHAVSAVGYSLFPLTGSGYDGTVQSFIHVYVVTVLVVFLSIVSLVLIAISSYRDHRPWLGTLAVIALFCMFFGAVGSANLPKVVFGLFERFSTYSAVLFTSILGIYWGRIWISK